MKLFQCPHCTANFGVEQVDGLDEYIDNECANARNDGYDYGHDAGVTAGYYERDSENPEPEEPRVADFRADLYRAIFSGDLDGAEDAANMMAMLDIDRDLIWSARSTERLKGGKEPRYVGG